MFENTQLFISGTSRGLGKALAEVFLKEGAKVNGISRSCTIEHLSYKHTILDLSNIEDLQTLQLAGDMDVEKMVLINNAGTLGAVKPFHTMKEEQIVLTANLNYIAPMLLQHKFMQLNCNEDCQKFVINIGSGAAYNAIDGWSLYCSTKAGLAMFTKVAHEESRMNKLNFKMVDLAPGIIDTAMQEEIRQSNSSDFSAVEQFINYDRNGDLQGAKDTAELIIRNFDRLFDKNQASNSIRNFK